MPSVPYHNHDLRYYRRPEIDYRWRSKYADIKRQGFLDTDSTSIAFDGTNTFTLSDAGAGWSYFRDGMLCTIRGDRSVTLPGSPVATGKYFIYIDEEGGSLTASTTAWTLSDTKVPVASIRWNNSLTPKYWMADERHTARLDSALQYYMHHVLGVGVVNMPSLSGYTVNTDSNTAKTFGVSAGTIIDQDLVITLAALSDPNGTATDYVLFYRTAASTWVWKYSNMPFAYNCGNTNDWIQWDNAGTMTDATGGTGANTRWVNSYLLLTNYAGEARFIVVPGRAIFTSLAEAVAENVAAFDWAGFEIDEAVIAYQLTWTTTTSTSQGKCRLAVAPKLVNIATVTNASSGAGTDHGTLAGLLDDDHTQYALLAGRSGGQTLYGGTGSGDDLTLQSTSNATKGDVLINTGGGNVGIGTASPGEKLEVYGDAPTIKIQEDSSSSYYLKMQVNYDAPTAARLIGPYGVVFLNYSTNAYSPTTLGAGAPNWVILNAARVGVGTESPSGMLDLVGGATGLLIDAQRTSHPTDEPAIYTTLGTGSAPFDAYGNVVIKARTNTGGGRSIVFQTGAGSGGSEAMRIDGAGKVGVGTASPQQALHVAGTILVDGDGGGYAGAVGLTDVTAGVSSGTGTVKVNGTTNRNSTGWLKIYVGTTAVYVPYFQTITG